MCMAMQPLPKTLKGKMRDTTLIVVITLVIFFVTGEILTRIFKKNLLPGLLRVRIKGLSMNSIKAMQRLTLLV